MDCRAPTSSSCLYKEIKLGFSSHPVAVSRIVLPSSSSFATRSRPQHSIFRVATRYRDEASFNKFNLSTSGSIYHGPQARYPRTIIWRILEEQTILELRSSDLSKTDRETNTAVYAIQLKFPVPLRHGAIALIDTDDPLVLNVFAITTSNEIYTCSIRRDMFCRAIASEDDSGRWCKIYAPATFSMSAPCRLIASSFHQLIVSLTDGRLLQLTRDKKNDGARWNESTYGDGLWGSSLRGLIKWQGNNTVRYNGAILEQDTPIMTAMSPDRKHVFAVCLNHTLRVWNLSKAAHVFSKDLLWQHREPQEIHRWMLDPGSPNVLQVFGVALPIDGDLYYAVTYSPHDFGQFKFWAVRDPDFPENGIRDLYADAVFKTPDPDPSPEGKTIWKVADFKVTEQFHGEGLELWVLMRSSKSYRVYKLRFDLLDVIRQWQDCWCIVSQESMNERPVLQPSDQYPGEDSPKWLKYLLRSGKYGDALLETALSVYRGLEATNTVDPKMPLHERMWSAVASRVAANKLPYAELEKQDLEDQEWSMLYQMIQDMDASRWDVLSLTIDNDGGTPWLAFADGCAPIRCCSRTETITQNSAVDLGKSTHLREKPSVERDDGLEPRLPDELASYLSTAAAFRRCFPPHLQRKFQEVVADELWSDASYSVPIRIQAFYDQCDFASEITLDHFQELERNMGTTGGFDGLDSVVLNDIVETFSHHMLSVSSGLLYTPQGSRALIQGARELIKVREQLLLDLLALVVFVDMETDREETPMVKFDGARTYAVLIDTLRQYRIMQWLVEHTRKQDKDVSSAVKTKGSALEGSPVTNITMLECMFASALKPQASTSQSESEALTYSIQDLLKWVTGGNVDPAHPVEFDNVLVYIQCDLLKHNDIDLASDFLRFQPSTALSTYIKGRLCLMKHRPSEAAICFKQAGFIIARTTGTDYVGATNELLSTVEAVCFGAGLPVYYTHIIALFSNASCSIQIAQFARLALQLGTMSEEKNDDLLVSLFEASLQVLDIDAAFSAMIRHTSPEESLLPTFIRKLLADPSIQPRLLSLPFPAHLYGNIDVLLTKSDKPKILAAWRLRHRNFQSAAAALLPDLKKLETQKRMSVSAQQSLDEGYLAIINLLACAGQDEDWLLTGGGAFAKEKRKLISLQDLRNQYQNELDRRSIIESGKYSFGGVADAMEVS